MSNKEKKLEEIFNACPNYCKPTDFVEQANQMKIPKEERDKVEVGCFGDGDSGFQVSWSEEGRGFGTYTFYVSRKDGKLYCDNECDSKETVKRVLCMMVDNATFTEIRE